MFAFILEASLDKIQNKNSEMVECSGTELRQSICECFSSSTYDALVALAIFGESHCATGVDPIRADECAVCAGAECMCAQAKPNA